MKKIKKTKNFCSILALFTKQKVIYKDNGTMLKNKNSLSLIFENRFERNDI